VESQPRKIELGQATTVVWGDDSAGRASDWFYEYPDDLIHANLFATAPGERWVDSEAAGFKPLYARHEVYFVVEGSLVLSNPATGEVHPVSAGDAVFLPAHTWHHGFNFGSTAAVILSLWNPMLGEAAPAPAAGAESVAARYGQDEFLGRWPAARAEAHAKSRMEVIREDDYLWRLEGERQEVLVGIVASTAQLTAGKVYVPAARRGAVHSHPGDEFVYLEHGAIQIEFPSLVYERASQPGTQYTRRIELNAVGECCYIPQGLEHRYANVTGAPARCIFGVAPHYK